MRFSISIQTITLLGLISRVYTAPTPLPDGYSAADQEIAGRYVVYINDTETRSLDDIFDEMGVNLGNSNITDRFDQSGLFRAFAGDMSHHCVKRMQEMKSSGSIVAFEEEIEYRAMATVEQRDATWGLQRISSGAVLPGTPSAAQRDRLAASLTEFSYMFDDRSQGEGVNVYVIDTGVLEDHVEFEGRAKNVFRAPRAGGSTDDNGHGTHCAGTVGSLHLGVAKKANILGVKVLRASGSATTSDIVSGLEFIVRDHNLKKNQPGFKGSVVSMSLGSTSLSDLMDITVVRASLAGIHFAVAAGNDNVNACGTSPGNLGRRDDIISVGAINIADERARFSNFGECVNVYAPGVDIRSTFIDERLPQGGGALNIADVLSGTSMATPHVAGLIAYNLVLNPELRDDPAGMKQLILGSAVRAPFVDTPQRPALIINNGIKRTQ